MKVALVGATGLVGGVMLQVLQKSDLPISDLIPVASQNSIGKKIDFKGKSYSVVSLEEAVRRQPNLAIFSAGGSTSLTWAPKFAATGTTVIDNSSAWRMDKDKKLIVPEINADQLTSTDKIIANPNCSTIQMVLALAPLHKTYGILRLVVATYQSVTGTGIKAVQQLQNEREGKEGGKVYPHPIDLNCLPHGGDFDENLDTTEETKLLNETRKILDDPSIQVTATVVRIPVYGGHSEAVNVEFQKDYKIDEVKMLLENMPGVKLMDDPKNNLYPTPRFAEGKDEVFVGRIRRDLSQPNSLNLWIVSDNLRKGAATNAVQIAEYLYRQNLL